MSKEFVCLSCGHNWTQEEDADGLYNGYGNPPCPVCGGFSSDASDYKDFVCPYCGHRWRNYGDGGLVYGCWPNCPECGTPAEEA